MAEYKEFTGKSQAEAVEKASRELDIPKEKLRYDILSHGSTGIFGLVGVKKAKIRVKVSCATAAPAAPVAEETSPQPAAEAAEEAKEAPAGEKRRGSRQGQRKRGRSRKKEQPAPAEAQEPVRAEAEAPAPLESPAESTAYADLIRDWTVVDVMEPDEGAPEEAPEAASGEAPRQRSFLAAGEELTEAAARIEQDLKMFCKYLLDDFAVSAAPAEDGHVLCKVEGQDTGLLIGRKGATLESIQLLLETMVNKGREHKVRVRVDAGGYQARREDNLSRMAKRLAEKVKRSGRPFSFSPMSAYDRRIVHLALKEEKELRTISKGTGSMRKLIILPKSMNQKKLPPDFDVPVVHDEEEELG